MQAIARNATHGSRRVTMTIEQLVAELDAADAVPVAWRAAFLAVPRHHFLPPQVWVDDDQGKPQPLSRDDDPGQWLESAYRNGPILIQFDDGQTIWPDTAGELCTSSTPCWPAAREQHCTPRTFP